MFWGSDKLCVSRGKLRLIRRLASGSEATRRRLLEETWSKAGYFLTTGMRTWLWDTDPPTCVFFASAQLLVTRHPRSKQEISQIEIINRPYLLPINSFDGSRALIVGDGSETRLSISIVDVLMRANWASVFFSEVISQTSARAGFCFLISLFRVLFSSLIQRCWI